MGYARSGVTESGGINVALRFCEAGRVRLRTVSPWLLITVVLLLAGCGTEPSGSAPPPPATSSPPTTTAAPPSTPPAAPDRWQVGAEPLPLRPDGFGQVLPTPGELQVRDLPTHDILPPPQGRYAATIEPVPQDVLARSTWEPACPVAATDLRYLTMSFWGFDDRPHTGEMLVNGKVAEEVTRVFKRLYEARYPIEEMRVTRADELDIAPTGDGNNTGAFVCKTIEHQSSWSAHAYGLAIDLNPFLNPYRKGDLVLPELASAYLDRGWRRPGMVFPGGVAVRAFSAIGWTWGGTWTSPEDLMHFSETGT